MYQVGVLQRKRLNSFSECISEFTQNQACKFPRNLRKFAITGPQQESHVQPPVQTHVQSSLIFFIKRNCQKIPRSLGNWPEKTNQNKVTIFVWPSTEGNGWNSGSMISVERPRYTSARLHSKDRIFLASTSFLVKPVG